MGSNYLPFLIGGGKVRLTHLRKSWPILASVGLILYWWLLARFIFPRTVTFNPLENINYWSLISLNGHKSAVVYVIAWALFIGLAGITAFYAWEYYGNLLLLVTWLLIAVACLGSLCIGLYAAILGIGSGYTLEHIQSVTFNGRVYQLAASIEHYDDFNVTYYVVFECDATGNTCRQLQSFPYYPLNNKPATLVVEDDSRIYIKQGNAVTRIRP